MMTGSEMPHNAYEIIEKLLDLLCSERIYREVEFPIDVATAEFQITMEGTMTQAIFNKVIADFVKLLYGKAIRYPRMLSDQEAIAEAIQLLTRYTDAEGPDRYGAILSIVLVGGSEELKKMPLQLSEIIKEVERRKYIQWVITCHFRNLEWKRQCYIVESYMESISQNLPAELQRLKPEQLVEYFEDLIRADVLFRNIFNGFHQEKQSWKSMAR